MNYCAVFDYLTERRVFDDDIANPILAVVSAKGGQGTNARKSSCMVNSQFPGDESLMRSLKGKPCVQAIPTLLSMVYMVLKEQRLFFDRPKIYPYRKYKFKPKRLKDFDDLSFLSG